MFKDHANCGACNLQFIYTKAAIKAIKNAAYSSLDVMILRNTYACI